MAWEQSLGSGWRIGALVHRQGLRAARCVVWDLARQLVGRARGRAAAAVPPRVRRLVRGSVKRGVALVRRPDGTTPSQPHPIGVQMRPAPPSAVAVARWTAKLATDESCIPGGAHEACGAAVQLAAAGEADRSVLEALENTVTMPGRPTCVRWAAVDTLGRLGTTEARTCLERMRTVTRRRLEWEGTSRERDLLDRIDAVIYTTSP